MTGRTLITQAALVAIAVPAGVVLGRFYFSALRRSVALLVGDGGWRGPVALTLGRIAIATTVLGIAAVLGAAPLLATLAGFLVARGMALRASGRAG